MFTLERNINVNGVDYKVVSVLENNLLLVANKTDVDNNRYPLPVFVVQDTWYLEEINKLK